MNERANVPPNPYDYIHPVQELALFAGREEELAAIAEETIRLSGVRPIAPTIGIIGPRRVGKTSLLLQVAIACSKNRILPVTVTLTDSTAGSPREFWREILDAILDAAVKVQILQYGEERYGFLAMQSTDKQKIQRLNFGRLYLAGMPLPPIQTIQDDLRLLLDHVITSDRSGVVLMIDEAHLLLQNPEVSQQIRAVLRELRIGIIFAGEPGLAKAFNDPSQPLFGQARVISLGNFASTNDVAECALLPLAEDQRPLVGPMTIDYLMRLSQGKPNQIRLICNSLYKRYERGEQADLNISIEVLDDVLESIESAYGSDYDLRTQVDRIRRLSSVDLEILYCMTRYPSWAIDDVVALDECFRGESSSQLAATRRLHFLHGSRSRFVEMGLLRDDPGRCALAGDEFLHLYLRFWYEVRKYGQLTKHLVLGRGPATPFVERIDKLLRFLSWQVQATPSIISTHTFGRDAETKGAIDAVRKRYSVLEDVLAGARQPTRKEADLLSECLHLSELVSEAGTYHLVALSIRNLDNPRESVRAEVYFRDKAIVVPIAQMKRQAEEARVWIEDFG